MYKHILLPTDGSALSEIAINKGLQFAKIVGAKVTGLYVMVERQVESFEDYAPVDTKGPALSEVAKQEADRYLGAITTISRAMNLSCETLAMRHASAHQAIIKTATDKGCDLIVMASHGRKGITGEQVGSETARVITNCKIPVLVYR
ncbi:MAG: universal stress protein [Betaproteobacteria bacterium]|nr:universal stress protein [Betaproteobacteria bacterium]